MTMYGQIEFDTPIYLVVYRMMGVTITGFPMYSIVKCYACDFCDTDSLIQQHANNVGNPVQWIAFYREPGNPFQGQAVDMGDPFASPLAMDTQQARFEIAAERERLRLLDEARHTAAIQEHEAYQASLRGTPEPNVPLINWGPDPFIVDTTDHPDDCDCAWCRD